MTLHAAANRPDLYSRTKVFLAKGLYVLIKTGQKRKPCAFGVLVFSNEGVILTSPLQEWQRIALRQKINRQPFVWIFFGVQILYRREAQRRESR